MLPGGAGVEEPQTTEEYDQEPEPLPDEPDTAPRRPLARNDE